MAFKDEKRSLLASNARVQTPWVKVTIGDYTFGVFRRVESSKDYDGYYQVTKQFQYPNFVQSLDVTKINGQVNQYTLVLAYPVTQFDDPNFFEKVLGSVSKSREIIFSYGDMSMPHYIYKEEKALITKVQTSFQLQGGVINYTISAVSSAALNAGANHTFNGYASKKPSDIIKRLFQQDATKEELMELFTGMNDGNIDKLVRGDDKEVYIATKQNISTLDYILYLVSCMTPASSTTGSMNDVYVLTIHDDTTFYDDTRDLELVPTGSYFDIDRVSYKTEKSDAYQIDIGFGNTGTIVTAFQVVDNENYALLYDYSFRQGNQYVQRIDDKGDLVDIWAPGVYSKNDYKKPTQSDINWWTKMTQFPIKATITLEGLLRPAMLMSYVRLNVIFPGGNKHVSSGLYMVTQQHDRIDGQSGYKTTLSLTKISGDDSIRA